MADEAECLPRDLQQCLEQIKNSDNQLVSDTKFIRLIDLIRRRGVL